MSTEDKRPPREPSTPVQGAEHVGKRGGGASSPNDGKEYGTAKRPAGGAHSDPEMADNKGPG